MGARGPRRRNCALRLCNVMAIVVGAVTAAGGGCKPAEYRIAADDDAYRLIAERNGDPRWRTDRFSIDVDPRSRYFDPHDPDHSPMPKDDPASAQYMRMVDGKKGWEHWRENGEREELENAKWKQALGEYLRVDDAGAVMLDIDAAVKLAYVHSPQHQRQLETLYLTALDVSGERFRLDSQFFGGYDVVYNHNGSLVPAGLAFDSAAGKYVVTPPVDVPGVESNRVTLGRGGAARPAFQMKKRFATAGDLLVGFANSFVFEFTGGDANLSSSLANFSFVQPLLRGAGRDVALEQLTFEERKLLANMRAYAQFRQGFYTQVAIGELGVNGPQRLGAGTNLQSFPGSGTVGGYLGLLQQRQQIRNDEDNLNLQLRTFARLNALFDNDLIDLVQVDQFEQNIESQRSRLLNNRNSLALAFDRYKTGTLGLPPDLVIQLDESLIERFQLMPRKATSIQDAIIKVQVRVGKVYWIVDPLVRIAQLKEQLNELADDADMNAVRELLVRIRLRVGSVQRRLDEVHGDLSRFDATEGPALADSDKQLVDAAQKKLSDGTDELDKEFELAKDRLQGLQDKLTEGNRQATVAENRVWFGELLDMARGCLLIQARVHRVDMEPQRVLREIGELIEPMRELFDDVETDLGQLDKVSPVRLRAMVDDEQRTKFRSEREQLGKQFSDREKDFDILLKELGTLREGLDGVSKRDATRTLVGWVARFLRVSERLLLVPARARVEAITVESLDLKPDNALKLALASRLDFMNGRAALVDRWRAIHVSADALQSVVNLTASGDVRTARNNPFSFRAPTGTMRLGLEFDAPLTRLLERNGYRETLIEFQRARREFIQSEDRLHLGLRALLRNLEQLRQNLEIQRRAVTIAIRRVDQTQLVLNPPRDAPAPGTRPPINPTTAINLLGAQQALRDSQNAFLGAWLNYRAARMRLYRELGLMKLDPQGRWVEQPIDPTFEEEGDQDE